MYKKKMVIRFCCVLHLTFPISIATQRPLSVVIVVVFVDSCAVQDNLDQGHEGRVRERHHPAPRGRGWLDARIRKNRGPPLAQPGPGFCRLRHARGSPEGESRVLRGTAPHRSEVVVVLPACCLNFSRGACCSFFLFFVFSDRWVKKRATRHALSIVRIYVLSRSCFLTRLAFKVSVLKLRLSLVPSNLK